MARRTGVLFEDDEEVDTHQTSFKQQFDSRRYNIVWRNVAMYTYIHLAAVCAIYAAFTSAKFLTFLSAIVFNEIAVTGLTVGGHRLWSHRSYKVKLPLKLLLLFAHTLAIQNSVIVWAREHRVHHKYSETNADPHNAKRGFFFAHLGWTMVRKHPDVITKGRKIDLSDLYNDSILLFQHKHYLFLMILIGIVVPIMVPMYLWQECFVNAWNFNLLRYCMGLQTVWIINSFGHMHGSRAYDRFISPSDNKFTSFITHGEGWHNYHHVFPWDYRGSEFFSHSTNFNTGFINLFAKLGWAYDLKTVSQEMIKKRVLRTGDGSHHVWGWSDNDMLEEDKECTIIVNKQSH